MQGDSFNDFLSQGPILRLFLVTAFFAAVWLGMVIWIAYRANERRRRKERGLPPLPNFLQQLINFFQNQQLTAGSGTTSANRGASVDDIPLPSMDDLTSDLPEPDLATLLSDPLPLPNADLPTPIPVVAAATAMPTPQVEIDTPPLLIDDEEEDDSIMAITSPSNEQRPSDIPDDAVEVMRVWRDLSDGSLIVQMGDKVFHTVTEMQDRGMAKRFINLVKDLARMAIIGAQAAGLPLPEFDAGVSVVSQQGAWANQKRLDSVPTTTTTELPVPEIRPEPTSASLGIADQIEELLQYRLMQTPIFQHRSIHVRANYDGSLRIEVDGRYYDVVEAVIDPDVREFLQRVIREWEARQ
ncbi:MAG: hypothetical protein H6673_14395 [Anaerolineales bacterium]|nr:hypothetical protein [Anaerolineales bacterium]